MGTPFLTEIRIASFNFAPRGWAMCNGQLLPINQNQAIFALLGTTYGGDGRVNFGLPNLQGRVPVHMGNGLTLGQVGGEIGHTLASSELPGHTHTLKASTAAATTGAPGGSVLAEPGTNIGSVYAAGASAQATQGLITGAMASQAVAGGGGGQPHSNLQPYLVLNFVIALQGIFPSQN